MKTVSLLAVIALTVLTLAASVASANPTDASGGNPYYQQAPQQGQYWMQNSSAYCYWGSNNYQQGGTSGWNNWNCW